MVFGTRPEWLKLEPLIQALHASPAHPGWQLEVIFTGQHPDLLQHTLATSPLPIAHRLEGIMIPEQPLNALVARIMLGLDPIFAAASPRSLVLVQGDTSSALAGAFAAFQRGLEVAHVEAGLRTSSLHSPFPEEANRRLITQLSQWHYAPTEHTRENLLRVGVPEAQILVTGNTSIDRLRALDALEEISVTQEERPTLFMSLHRRENLERLEPLLEGMAALLAEHADWRVFWPLHPNTRIVRAARKWLRHLPNMTLLEPLSHAECVARVRRADLVITDSGGIQEEAITLGTPLLVWRDQTDRPEGMSQGRAVLSGGEVSQMLDSARQMMREIPERFQECSIYGDGHAGARIAAHVRALMEA